MVEREEFQELYRRLREWAGSGGIDLDTYHLGLHILQRMVKYDSLEIGATWGEFQKQTVVGGIDTLAGPIKPGRYHFYGALHQLQERVGIFSHLSPEGLEEVMQDAKANEGIAPHFTAMPGVDSHVIGDSTIIIFAYRRWAGYSVRVYSESILEETKPAKMPAWLHKTPRGAGGKSGSHSRAQRLLGNQERTNEA